MSVRSLGRERAAALREAVARGGASRLNSFVWRPAAETLAARVSETEGRWRRGEELSMLDGVSVAVKDAFCTLEGPTTAGSRLLASYESPFEATAVARLRAAGAVVVGKNNMDEFCMGSSNIHSHFGPVKNPLHPHRIPGGSSGGTAAAVAEGCAQVGLGTDTGGSVRQPAALCGIVGFKPSYGAISRHGVVAMSSSLDTVGILARHVSDAALVFETVRGLDGYDMTAHAALQEENPLALEDVRVAVSSSFYPEEMDDCIVDFWRSSAILLGWDGQLDLDVNYILDSLPTYYVISSAEAASNLARYDGLRYGFRAEQHEGTVQSLRDKTREEGFGEEAKRRIELGNFVLSQERKDEFFTQAQRVRRVVAMEFERAFRSCDILMVPTVASLIPPTIEEVSTASDPIQEWMSDLLTVPASLAGLPAISVPVGSHDGYPISMQIIGPRFADNLVLRVAEHLINKLHT